MAQIFVSHSSADSPLAVQVRDCLGDLGYDSVFLDVSPTDGLVPGTAWRDQLFTNLDRSDALVFVGTPAANASLWCHSELALARWLRKPILSLLFDGVDPHELVADIQGINLASADLSADIVRPGLVVLGLEQAQRWDATRSPYPGLRAFDESYAPVFVGRERQVDQLRQLVDPPSRLRQGVVVPVLGPSGSGKSSLVRAGLVAALRPAPDWVVSDPWTPSDAPLAELSLALAHAAKRHEVALDADECRTLLTTPGGMPEYVRRLREGGDVPAEARVLVVVDQAEELVTLTPETERKAFLEALALSCAPPSPLRVVMTARTDMWDSVSALTNRFEMTVAPAVLHVPPLSRADLARVIAEPAKRSHLVLEEGLLQRLVEDTESGDALPLLAYTLQRMTGLAQDGQLTHALYDSVGGVRGAIALRAGEVAHGARSQAEVAAAILHIVGTGENRPVTRLARLDTVPAPQREILDDLVDARLVVIRESAGQQVYAPAHEALFSAWPPLAEMIKHRHDDLRLRSRLERRANDWREGGGGSSGLLSGVELGQAVTWDERNPDLRTPDITAYVDASTFRARRNRLLRVGTAAVVAGLAIALVAVLLVNAHDDRVRARTARVGELRAIAERELVHDPVAAAIALLAAYEVDPEDAQLPGLARSLLRSPARDSFGDPNGSVGALAIAVGSRRAVASMTDASGGVLDVRTGQALGTLPWSGAVSVRRDDRVAVASGLDALYLYDLGEQEPTELASFGTTSGHTAFSPSGALLAAASGAVVQLWDVSDPAAPTRLHTWRAPGSGIDAITVLDDGRVLASGDAADLMSWTPERPDDYQTLLAADTVRSGTAITAIDADDEGERALLGLASFDGVALVDLATGEVVTRLPASEPGLNAGTTFTGAMSRDGSLVVAFDVAGRGFVFDSDSGDLVGRLTGGHTALVNGLGFGPSGTIVSAGLEGLVRTWDGLASGLEGSDPGALCETFAPRIDEASWQVAMGEEPFASPCADGSGDEAPQEADLEVAAADLPAPSEGPSSTTVLDERFDAETTPLGTGGTTVGTGSLDRRLVDGHYEMQVRGQGPAFQTWTMAGTEPGSTDYSYSVRMLPGDGQAACGLTVAGTGSQLTVTVDPSDGSGELTWFSGGGSLGSRSFTTSAPSAYALELVADGLRLEVRADGDRVVALRDDRLGRARDVGLVTVGSHTCAFDDLLLESR